MQFLKVLLTLKTTRLPEIQASALTEESVALSERRLWNNTV